MFMKIVENEFYFQVSIELPTLSSLLSLVLGSAYKLLNTYFFLQFLPSADVGHFHSRVKKMSLGENLFGSHAYNLIRDSRRDFFARVSPKVSDQIICMTSGKTLRDSFFYAGLTRAKGTSTLISLSADKYRFR